MVAAILAVIVLALSAQSFAAVKHIDQEFFPGGIELDPSQFRYPNIGIASGAMTIVSVPILYVKLSHLRIYIVLTGPCASILSDLISAGCPIVVELLWFSEYCSRSLVEGWFSPAHNPAVTWILFAVTGGLALKEAHTFSSGLAEADLGGCSDLSSVGSDFVTLCRDARPLGIVAILAMGMRELNILVSTLGVIEEDGLTLAC